MAPAEYTGMVNAPSDAGSTQAGFTVWPAQSSSNQFQDANGGKLVYPGDYVGIYVLLEKIKIDNNRVNISKLDGGDNHLILPQKVEVR